VLLFDKKAIMTIIVITVALNTEGGTPVMNMKHNSPVMVKIDLRCKLNLPNRKRKIRMMYPTCKPDTAST
jgi:hypothetical protein